MIPQSRKSPYQKSPQAACGWASWAAKAGGGTTRSAAGRYCIAKYVKPHNVMPHAAIPAGTAIRRAGMRRPHGLTSARESTAPNTATAPITQ
ncbi:MULTISPECIES: hypothetical protein [unclassified Streptomyces]|uniref:hypothetical protein n=1 Tax=unclassified Streptomyces TaxID=2593676 RepID=UPI0004BE1B3E|nr:MULTISPECIES: hypothetical protein [unclassified Streptomyces]